MTILKVVETFTSIQGESTYAGIPCFFIRFAGCNQKCSYCDTEYAQGEEEAKILTVEELVAEAIKSKCSVVEITGGEPLVQYPGTKELAEELLKQAFVVLIETNGTIDLHPLFYNMSPTLREDLHIIMDIKCPSSGVMIDKKIVRGNIGCMNEKDEVKFVIGTVGDFSFMKGWIRWMYTKDSVSGSPPGAALISAVWEEIHPSELANRILHDRDLFSYPIRMQIQMHKIIWDPSERKR